MLATQKLVQGCDMQLVICGFFFFDKLILLMAKWLRCVEQHEFDFSRVLKLPAARHFVWH